MERRHKVEQGKYTSFSQGIKDFVDAGDGELLVVHLYPDVAILLGDGDHGAGVRRCRVLNEACSQVLAEYSIGLLNEDSVDPVGAGEHVGVVRGSGNFERNKRGRAKIGFGCVEGVGKLAEDVSEVFDYRRGSARIVEVERKVV